MKKYTQLSNKVNWKELLHGVNENIALCNRDENTWICSWGTSDVLNIAKGKYNPEDLDYFLQKNKGNYIFGYLAYNLKNRPTRSHGKKRDDHAKDIFLMATEHTIIAQGKIQTYFGEMNQDQINTFLECTLSTKVNSIRNHGIELKETTGKSEYLEQVINIQQEIQLGNFYEVNHCIRFHADYEEFYPKVCYSDLLLKTKAPFSCYFENNEEALICASPERFLLKQGNKLLSQPIKGTAKRHSEKTKDHEIALDLESDIKERAENIMIVDLVRNDLSRIAEKNSVNVDELCHIYSFETVHQMISSISCRLKSDISFSELLEALFPMGSMTGAPKISAMNSIEERENFNRELYSGSVILIDPLMNFDSNVVIRSIIDNKLEKQLYAGVGGAITIKSDPEKEYEECLLKLEALKKVLC